MAHVVCVTHGRTGLLYSSFELVRRLKEAGHQVTYLTQPGAVAAVEAQGITCQALPAFSEPPPRGQAASDLSLFERLRTITSRRQHAVDALGSPAFANVLHALSPDVLLIDMELHAHVMTAVPMGIPTALLSAFFSVWKRPGLPPLHKQIMPGQGWRGQPWGVEWAWFRFYVGKFVSRLSNSVHAVGVDDISVYKRLAQQTGFPFREETARYEWLLPFTYRTLPVLCLNAFELDFPHDPHPAVRYVGPMIHRQRQDAHTDPATEASLQSICVARSQPSNSTEGRPLVLVACSTFATAHTGFIEGVLRAASLRPDWDVVLSLGDREAAGALSDVPDTVHVYPWIPMLDLLPHTDVVVTNAGINTINECIRFGAPPIVYSLGTNDQNGTAARVAYHAVGVVGELDELSAETMIVQIEHALNDEAIRTNLDRLQRRFKEYECERRAVQVVEELLTEGEHAS